jgi:hypothetical protein
LNGRWGFATSRPKGNRISGKKAYLIRLYQAAMKRAAELEPMPAGG